MATASAKWGSLVTPISAYKGAKSDHASGLEPMSSLMWVMLLHLVVVALLLVVFRPVPVLTQTTPQRLSYARLLVLSAMAVVVTYFYPQWISTA